MNKTESATEIEAETRKNYLQLFLYRAPKNRHDAYAAAAGHDSKITLSLNDYTNSVSKLILPNLLGAASNNRVYGFLAPRIAAAAICSWNFGPNSK
jgi:hypothetical protein